VKVNRKIVFAVAYIIVALIAYTLFVKYSYAKYDDYTAIKRAEWIAAGHSAEDYDNYAQEPFRFTVYGRNMVTVGWILALVTPIVFHVVFTVQDRRKKSQIR